MRRTKEDDFIRAYCAAYKAGLTRQEFADSIGVTSRTVYQRAWEINAEGHRISLPLLPLIRPTDTGALIRAELREEEEQDQEDAEPEQELATLGVEVSPSVPSPLTNKLTDEDRRNLEALGLNLENS